MPSTSSKTAVTLNEHQDVSSWLNFKELYFSPGLRSDNGGGQHIMKKVNTYYYAFSNLITLSIKTKYSLYRYLCIICSNNVAARK